MPAHIKSPIPSGKANTDRAIIAINWLIADAIIETTIKIYHAGCLDFDTSAFQEWTVWLYENYTDYVVAMTYTDDPDLMRLNAGAVILPDLEARVQIGVGAYLMKDNFNNLKKQLDDLLWLSPSGIVIFSYDEIAVNEDLQRLLEDHFRQKPSSLAAGSATTISVPEVRQTAPSGSNSPGRTPS